MNMVEGEGEHGGGNMVEVNMVEVEGEHGGG